MVIVPKGIFFFSLIRVSPPPIISSFYMLIKSGVFSVKLMFKHPLDMLHYLGAKFFPDHVYIPGVSEVFFKSLVTEP
jgi:hypothetical protein